MFRILIVALVLMAASVYGVRMMQDVRPPAEDAGFNRVAEQRRASSRVIIEAENGHFATDARVDGREVRFMVDTGASQITLRASDAARLGYRPRSRDYNIRVQTANGEGRAALIELRRVEVDGILVRDVRALVVPDEALAVNLLGMSFLSKVSWSHERGQLVLEQ